MNSIYKDLVDKIPPETRRFVNHSVEIGNLICDELKRQGISIDAFAELVKQDASEIARWTSGTHNFDLKTISLIEIVLNVKIVILNIKKVCS